MYRESFATSGRHIYTLPLSENGKHADGWVIVGDEHGDWYKYIGGVFEAKKGRMRVWGDLGEDVFATSKRAFDDFMKNHAPTLWDSWDD